MMPGCLCLKEVGFVCSLHRGDVTAYSQEDCDSLQGGILSEKSPIISDKIPWNPDTLPERLRGLGYRGADQDGYNGSEWVTPEEDHEAQMIEAAKVLFDATLIEA
jgi:hypothetical protein